jgi:hypothetical protein
MCQVLSEELLVDSQFEAARERFLLGFPLYMMQWARSEAEKAVHMEFGEPFLRRHPGLVTGVAERLNAGDC